jgi:hypothetical protein
MDEIKSTFSTIMGVPNIDTVYNIERYKEKIKEIKSNDGLKQQIRNILTAACSKIESSDPRKYEGDVTIMTNPTNRQMIASENYGKYERQYIYLIPVGEFQNFLTLIGIDSDCSDKLLKMRKDNERHLGLSSMFSATKKDITGTSIGPNIGGRKTRRHKKSKRSGKSKRRRHRKTRK